MRRIFVLFIISFFVAPVIRAQIYYNDTVLSSSRIIGNKVGNIAGAYLTFGLSAANSNKVVEGASSSMEIAEEKPEFRFVFSSTTDSMLIDPLYMDYIVLVKLHDKKKTRQIRTGKYGLVAGVQTGLNEDDIIPLSVEQQNDSVYMVSPKTELEKGEYCFYYVEKVPRIRYVYDFAITK